MEAVALYVLAGIGVWTLSCAALLALLTALQAWSRRRKRQNSQARVDRIVAEAVARLEEGIPQAWT